MGEHCGGRRAEAEDRVLDHWLASAHRCKEIAVVVEMIVIALRRQILLRAFRPHGVGNRWTDGVLLAIIAQELFLNALGEGLDRVTGFLLTGVSSHRHTAA